MKKKLMMFICVCLSGMIAHADSYSCLTFQKADGTVTSVSVASLTMTFSDGKLHIGNEDGSYEFALADLSSMYFSNGDVTPVKGITSAMSDGDVEAFTLQRMSLGKFCSLQELKQRVPAGVYMVKSNGKTQKTVFK